MNFMRTHVKINDSQNKPHMKKHCFEHKYRFNFEAISLHFLSDIASFFEAISLKLSDIA